MPTYWIYFYFFNIPHSTSSVYIVRNNLPNVFDAFACVNHDTAEELDILALLGMFCKDCTYGVLSLLRVL